MLCPYCSQEIVSQALHNMVCPEIHKDDPEFQKNRKAWEDWEREEGRIILEILNPPPKPSRSSRNRPSRSPGGVRKRSPS